MYINEVIGFLTTAMGQCEFCHRHFSKISSINIHFVNCKTLSFLLNTQPQAVRPSVIRILDNQLKYMNQRKVKRSSAKELRWQATRCIDCNASLIVDTSLILHLSQTVVLTTVCDRFYL